MQLKSDELVPGDLIKVPHGSLPCDMAVVSGQCLVDESNLTGESLPVGKKALERNQEVYDPSKDAKNTLFAGSKVLQASDDAKGVVIKTGF